MNHQSDSPVTTLTNNFIKAFVAFCVAVWLANSWATNNFGETGAIIVGVLVVVVGLVGVIIAVGMMLTRLYQAGAVDAMRIQQYTHEQNAGFVKSTTSAMRPELVETAKVNRQLAMRSEPAQLTVQDDDEAVESYWRVAVPADEVLVDQ